MSLPTLTLELRLIDPEWTPTFEGSSLIAVNTDTMYKVFSVECEVVQLNINAGTMRVRYDWPSKRTKKGYEVCTRDVSLDLFYEHYEIKKRPTTLS